MFWLNVPYPLFYHLPFIFSSLSIRILTLGMRPPICCPYHRTTITHTTRQALLNRWAVLQWNTCLAIGVPNSVNLWPTMSDAVPAPPPLTPLMTSLARHPNICTPTSRVIHRPRRPCREIARHQCCRKVQMQRKGKALSFETIKIQKYTRYVKVLVLCYTSCLTCNSSRSFNFNPEEILSVIVGPNLNLYPWVALSSGWKSLNLYPWVAFSSGWKSHSLVSGIYSKLVISRLSKMGAY